MTLAPPLAAVQKTLWEFERSSEKRPAWAKEPDPRNAKKGGTVGANLGRLTGEGLKQWSMISLEQASEIAASIYSCVKSVGFPYLAKYSNMEKVYKLLTTMDMRDSGLPKPTRCERALTLAYCLRDPSAIEKVEIASKSILAGPDLEAGRARFASLEATLKLKLESGELPKIEQWASPNGSRLDS